MDESGIIRGANRSALFQLDERYESLVDRSVDTVFDVSINALIDMARKPASSTYGDPYCR